MKGWLSLIVSMHNKAKTNPIPTKAPAKTMVADLGLLCLVRFAPEIEDNSFLIRFHPAKE